MNLSQLNLSIISLQPDIRQSPMSRTQTNFQQELKNVKQHKLIIDLTPTHQMTTHNYSLNQVQRELDFNSKYHQNNQLLNNKYNLQNNTTTFYKNSTPNNFNTTKSLSFCANATPNFQSPTGNKFNIYTYTEYKPKIIPFNTDPKFSTNKEEVLDFKINMENIIIGKDKRTTVMLRNIPNKYTLQNVVDEINSSFWGKYDYINLPIDYEVFKVLKIEETKSRLCFH